MADLEWQLTWPDEPGREDWTAVDSQGLQVARVLKIELGPLAGRWQWTARVMGFPNFGTTATKEAAMEAAGSRCEEGPIDR